VIVNDLQQTARQRIRGLLPVRAQRGTVPRVHPFAAGRTAGSIQRYPCV